MNTVNALLTFVRWLAAGLTVLACFTGPAAVVHAADWFLMLVFYAGR